MQGGVTQLLHAEAAAEEILSAFVTAGSEGEATRIREEVEREKLLLLEGARRKVEEIRRKAETREEETVQCLLTLLFETP